MSGGLSVPHLHVVEDFEEGEGHAASDDHLIDLIQHVVDQLDLIFHLRSEITSRRNLTNQITKNFRSNISLYIKR